MIVLLRLLAAYAGLFAVGALAAGVLARGRTRLERAALALPLGAVVVSLVAFWLSLAGVERALDVTSAVVAAAAIGAVALAAGGWRQARAGATRRRPAATAGRVVWVGALTVLILAGLVAAAAVGRFQWDGLMVWGLKARIFALEGHVPTGYFLDASRQFSHLNYPLGLPLTEAWIYRVGGDAREAFTKPLFPLYLFSLLALLYCAVRGGFRGVDGGGLAREKATAVLAALAITPLTLPLTTWGYADLPLATLVLGSATSLWQWLERADRRALLLAGILAAAGVWTKREGAVFWAVAAALVALAPAGAQGAAVPSHERARGWPSRGRDLLRFAWPALALLPWFAFLRQYHVPDSDFAMVSRAELLHRLARAPEVAWLVVRDLANVSEWAVLWLLVLAVTLRGWRRPWSVRERWFAAMIVAYVGGLSCSYLLSTWVPWQPHVTLSVGRLIFHVTPVAIWLAALRWRAGERP